MGLAPSLMGFPGGLMGFPGSLIGMGTGTGMPSTPMTGMLMGTLYSRFLNTKITEFEEFHIIILDIFNTFNSALPGKHYDVPAQREVRKCYEQWEGEVNQEKKEEIFIEFMKNHVGLSRLDDYTLMTGVLTPPMAIAAKKAGESIPQLSIIKVIPDVIFVPAATVIALITAKMSKKIFVKNTASSD